MRVNGGGKQRNTQGWRRRAFALTALAALTLGAGLPLTGAGPALADETTAQLDIKKEASDPALVAGETMTYTIDVSCSAITDVGCRNAIFTDEIPAEFEIVSVDVTNAPHLDPVIDGQTVTVQFNEDLGDGTAGLVENKDGTVTITVRLREDLPYEKNGVPIPNTASVVADNALEKESTATVTPEIPLKLGTSVEKSFNPAVSEIAPGTETTLGLSASNTSNAGVESLTITDPVDPTKQPNPFTYLGVTGIAGITYPDNADTATLEYWNGTAWVEAGVAQKPGAPNAPPADAQGIRVTFSSSSGEKILAGATGGLDLTLEQRPNVAELIETTVVDNDAQSEVVLGEEHATATDDADYTMTTEKPSVEAGKSFTPNKILPGEDTVVSLSGKNNGEISLTELTIREPSTGTFDPRLEFTGFTAPVQLPQGADTASLKLVYLDKNGDEQTLTVEGLGDGDAFPALPDDFGSLQYFEVTYEDTTGERIISGAEATIEFGATAKPDLEKDVEIPNHVGVTGSAGGNTVSDVADDTLVIDEEHIDLETKKKISPGQIWGFEGEKATVQLPTKVSESSTGNAHEIVVSDPELNADGSPADSDWWEHFRPTAINKTDVPVGATLTVRYWDTAAGAWKDLPGAVGVDGSFTMEIPEELRDQIGGLQFVFTNDGDGFPPGTEVQPNITTELKENLKPKPEGSDITVENCSAASASGAEGVTPGQASVEKPCPTIDIQAPVPGEWDFLWKEWIEPGDQLVDARSGDYATSRLNWDTGGFSTYEQMVIADTRVKNTPANAGPADDVSQTTYEALNLMKIRAITPEMDPYLAWDLVRDVQLWNGTDWVTATNATGLPYRGQTPDISLTTAEQQSTTAVRLVFEEDREAREASNDPDAPQPGTGVSRSNANNDRKIDLVWQLRDERRSNGGPVIGSEIFNTTTEGDVNNIASATAQTGGQVVGHDTDSDILSILDRPLNVSVTKGWTGGPLGIPPEGTAPEQYPSGRITISASNASQANVDSLTIEDPILAEGERSPFDVFDLRRIVAINNDVVGANPDKTTVQLNHAGTWRSYAPGAARALTEAELADVTAVKVSYEGRIVSGSKSTLVMDLRLRATDRTSGEKITTVDSPVRNTAQGSVSDLDKFPEHTHTATDTDDAAIALQALNIGVTTTKHFDPTLQYRDWPVGTPEYETAQWEPVTMTLTAQPKGSARPAEMTVTDQTPSFWNAYEFLGFDPSFALASPIQQVRVDAFVGGTFTITEPGNTLEVQNGNWVEGEFATTPQLPAGVGPGDVQGLRFTFTRTDGSQWENPANPKQVIPITMKRLGYLRSLDANGDKIATPTDEDVSAPGEPLSSSGGRYTNTVETTVRSATNGLGGAPLTAEDDATAQIQYVAGGIQVNVKKTPVGAQPAGKLIPFQLIITNPATGGVAQAISNPKIQDLLPVIDGKPMLIFDPESDTPRFEYEFSPGPLAATGSDLPMPVDPKRVTVGYDTNADGEPTTINFSFKEGTALMPGDVYTITVNMMFRPGMHAGVANEVTNTVGVSADKPFESCNESAPESGMEIVDCLADTQVYPTAVGALSGKKFVKADDTELGVTNVTNPAASCAPSLDDFYAGDCVPITKPLHTETWRERIQNTGTLPMDRVITVDRLPTPNDLGAIVMLPRGSEWRPTWEGGFQATASEGYRSDFAKEPELFYSTSVDPCIADLHPAEADECPSTGPAAWQPLPKDLDPASELARSITNIKTVFTFEDDALFAPGDLLGYSFQTRTPATAPKMTTDSVAWNTIAIGAETVIEEAGERKLGQVLATEGRRVGVALATGPLSVEKTVSGNGAAFAPETFQLALSCVVPHPDGGAAVTLDPISLTLTAGEKLTLPEQLPFGAECTLTEVAGANGETEVNAEQATATIGRDTDPLPLVTLDNVYELTGFDVSKQVVGAVNQDGEAIDYGSFTVAASCSFLGEPVFAEGFDAEHPMTKAIVDGETWTLTGLPVNADCSVTETEANGGESVITVNGEPQGETFTLSRLAEGKHTVAVLVTNTFPLGAIEIVKELDGAGADALAPDTTFTFRLVCTLEEQTVWDGEQTLTKQQIADGERIRVDTLPAGAECAVTETGAAGATESTLTPDTSAAPITVGTPEEPLVFTAVNTFASGGELIVEKQITGSGAVAAQDKTFTVSLSCVVDPEGSKQPVAVPGGAERELSAKTGLTASYAGLPLGAACELVETETGGAAKTTITPNAGDPLVGVLTVGEANGTLTVVNEFEKPTGPGPQPTPDPTPSVPGGKTPGLSDTGGQSPLPWLIGAAGLLLLGGVFLARTLRTQAKRRDAVEGEDADTR